MRIAHVVDFFLPPSETFIYTQLQSQRDLEQIVLTRQSRNLESFPFPNVRELDRARVPQARRTVNRLRRLHLLPDVFRSRIESSVRRFETDVVHAHFGTMGAVAAPAAVRAGCPIITAFHGRDVYAPTDRFGGAEALYRYLFRHGSVFTCVGPQAGEELVRIGCARDRIRVVPVGLDLTQFPFTPAARDGDFQILQIARLIDKKGVDTTLRAYAAARAQLGSSHLSIVGDGPDRTQLEQLARTLGLDGTVTFHGALAPAAVRELIRQTHLGVQPSRVAANGDREGTPTVLLEFQAMGVDVAATRHADIPTIVAAPDELISEGDHDGLARAMTVSASLTSTERANRLAAGRALVEARHDAVKVAVVLRSIYEHAVAARGTQTGQ
jgi:colanic acid/amylovoran biosynthesis glycosyltransferase